MKSIDFYLFFYFCGPTYNMLASFETGIVCRYTVPGPFNDVTNNPSPPNKTFLTPFNL